MEIYNALMDAYRSRNVADLTHAYTDTVIVSLADFARGVRCLYDGLQCAHGSTKVRGFTKRYVWVHAACFCLALIVVAIMYAIARVILGILSSVYGDAGTWKSACGYVAFYSLWQVPFCSLFFLRVFFYQQTEDAFFEVLTIVDPAVADSLNANPRESITQLMWSTLTRHVRVMLMIITFGMCSQLPNPIGPLVVCVAAGYSSWRKLGPIGFIVLGGLSWWKPIWPVITVLIQYWLLARAWRSDILYPWVGRQKGPRKYATMRAKESLIMGYCLPSTVILAIPFVGPLFWFYVTGGAALLIPDLDAMTLASSA
eukprot:GEMP01038687.1.p1 GENE.GEMP01038687.1~~GEMP01038687.1.p1  ORF type:complete len:313 (+),score=32.76 GEMP01038687.1:161-1099(+)